MRSVRQQLQRELRQGARVRGTSLLPESFPIQLLSLIIAPMPKLHILQHSTMLTWDLRKQSLPCGAADCVHSFRAPWPDGGSCLRPSSSLSRRNSCQAHHRVTLEHDALQGQLTFLAECHAAKGRRASCLPTSWLNQQSQQCLFRLLYVNMCRWA